MARMMNSFAGAGRAELQLTRLLAAGIGVLANLIMGFAVAVHGADTFIALWAVNACACISLLADGRLYGARITHAFLLWCFIGGPLLVPIYLVRTRGWSGALIAAGLMVIWLGTLLAGTIFGVVLAR